MHSLACTSYRQCEVFATCSEEKWMRVWHEQPPHLKLISIFMLVYKLFFPYCKNLVYETFHESINHRSKFEYIAIRKVVTANWINQISLYHETFVLYRKKYIQLIWKQETWHLYYMYLKLLLKITFWFIFFSQDCSFWIDQKKKNAFKMLSR